jgi:hypothetical protein
MERELVDMIAENELAERIYGEIVHRLVKAAFLRFFLKKLLSK